MAKFYPPNRIEKSLKTTFNPKATVTFYLPRPLFFACLSLTPAGLAQSVERLNAEREVAGSIACEQALLSSRAKRAAQERVSRASRASTFQDIPQMKSLLAGYGFDSAGRTNIQGIEITEK